MGLEKLATDQGTKMQKSDRQKTKNKWSLCLPRSHTHLNVATLQSQAEAGLLVLHEVQRHLRIALLLQVGNDGLAHQLSITYHVQHLMDTIRTVNSRKLVQ